MNIKEYFEEFTQDLRAEAGVGENYLRITFVERMCSLMEAEGFVSEYSLASYKYKEKGLAVDAWSYDENLAKLTLFLADYRDSSELQTLIQRDVADNFKRLSRFVEACLKQDFVKSLDESMPVTALAWHILKTNGSIKQLSLVILSNAALSSRVAKLPKESVAKLNTQYDIWDFARIFRSETSGREREDIEIDFSEFNKEGISCLPAYLGEDSMKSYLMAMPGSILATLYERHGERLLEQNVRTFLQFRGNINKGMRNTIINEPHMFFSYNNGLSATAEEVKTNKAGDQLLSIRNLQIVNGGQTTASIFTAGRKEKGGKGDLSKVYVQVKLSVVAPEQVEDIVPRISEYANTQNKVSAADFFSNHPFHRKIEEFSRRLWAPAPIGFVQETHWFYERARGQFINKYAGLKHSEAKKFLLKNPKSQMFTKTDLAKYVRTFDELPHEVSKGSQKNFSSFAGELGKNWERNEGNEFNELWFKQLVGKAILFRQLDSHILRAGWYTGYKANIVTYALSKFSNMVRSQGDYIDFLKIWDLQTLPDTLAEQLMEIAEKVNSILLNPPSSATGNVSEWAKSESCWKAVRSEKMDLNDSVEEFLIDSERERELKEDAAGDDEIQVSVHTQMYVIEKGAEYWKRLLSWDNENHKLTEKEIGILTTACQIPKKIPSDKQADVLVEAEKRAKLEGFFPD